MATLKILLVDDEYLALQLLEEYAAQLPGLEVVGKIKSPVLALEFLQNHTVDILFLDIQMPVLGGLNLLKSLPRPPAVIFTTAYSEYAVQAFDLNAVDYLLKPFSFERFVQAVNKAKTAALTPPKTAEEGANYIVVKVDGRLEKIAQKDILYVEGLKEYARLVCAAKQYVTFERLKNIEEMLSPKSFLRVHKSFIVAVDKVLALEGNQLDLGKQKIPISREKKDEVVRTIFGGGQ